MEPIVRHPKNGETFEEYLESYTPEEKTAIFLDEGKTREFCKVLVTIGNQKVDGNFQRLARILDDLYDHERFLCLMNIFEQRRVDLLKVLDPGELRAIYKRHSIIRLAFCSADFVSVLGSYYLSGSNPNFSKLAASASNIIGGGIFFNSIIELKSSLSLLDYVVTQLERDQEHFAPIQEWYQQSNELKNAMKSVFSFDQTERLLKSFVSTAGKEFDKIAFLSRFLRQVVTEEASSTVSKEIEANATVSKELDTSSTVSNLISFVLMPKFKELCVMMIFRRKYEILLDAIRALQCYEKKLLSSQTEYIPLVKKFSSIFPSDYNQVFAIFRLVSDLVSIVNAKDSLMRLDTEPCIVRMEDLRKQMEGELETLRWIKNFILTRQQAE